MTTCQQCGRCCNHIILPFHKGAVFDPILCALRGIVIHDLYMIVPCQCRHVYQGNNGKWYCTLYRTADFPAACTEQKAGGLECSMLHEVFP